MNMPLSVNCLFYTFFTRSIITFINLFLPNGYSFGFFRHRRTAVNMVFISVSYRKIHIFLYRLFFNIHVFKRNVCFFKCIFGTFMRDKMQNDRYTHHYRKQRQGKQQNNFFFFCWRGQTASDSDFCFYKSIRIYCERKRRKNGFIKKFYVMG